MLGKILLAICVLIPLIAADIYMHNPRGSNNRNCEFTPNGNANNNVGNANRLFRSENNGEGGYNCPQGRDRNSDPNKAILVETPRMYYYTGSKLKVEWTAQHACGGNNHCQIVLQYTCGANVRDGKPNPDSNDGNERQGTGTITQATKDSPFYGLHEPYEHYKNCATRNRNKGLYAGVVQINGESARFTRQNGNGNDYGFECQEERDYYPYWHTSPWKDIAVFTSNTSMCEWYQQESQNVKSRFECIKKDTANEAAAPNNRQECLAAGHEWKEFPAFGIAPPECRSTDEVNTSDNHLGNTVSGEMASYWWTIPNDVNENCAIRVRYNITTGEFHPFETDSTKNGPNSPVKTTTNSNGNYYTDLGYGWELAVKMNPNQLGRTFQDRSFVFSIKARPTNIDANANIVNFNIRGKRGNLVNIYPATEYDFTPNKVNLNGGDYLHIQWTGSDFNQNREPNNAEGGPKVPLGNAANNYAADRHNLVQLDTQQANIPRRAEHVSMFLKEDGSKNMDLIKKLALLDQPFDDPSDTVVCKNYTQLLTLTGNNANNANLHHQNCAKLAGAKTPYFDAGLVRMVASGTFTVGSTRNNNFSNRSQKSVITVTNGWYASASKTSAGVAIGFAMIAALVALLL